LIRPEIAMPDFQAVFQNRVVGLTHTEFKDNWLTAYVYGLNLHSEMNNKIIFRWKTVTVK